MILSEGYRLTALEKPRKRLCPNSKLYNTGSIERRYRVHHVCIRPCALYISQI